MTMTGIIPTFRVKDAGAAERFYCDVLGFRTAWEHDPGDGYPVFVEVARDKVAIHLSGHEGDGPEAREEMPWGDVVYTVTDPDGNVMRFGLAR